MKLVLSPNDVIAIIMEHFESKLPNHCVAVDPDTVSEDEIVLTMDQIDPPDGFFDQRETAAPGA